jgi:hypothetical protein
VASSQPSGAKQTTVSPFANLASFVVVVAVVVLVVGDQTSSTEAVKSKQGTAGELWERRKEGRTERVTASPGLRAAWETRRRRYSSGVGVHFGRGRVGGKVGRGSVFWGQAGVISGCWIG